MFKLKLEFCDVPVLKFMTTRYPKKMAKEIMMIVPRIPKMMYKIFEEDSKDVGGGSVEGLFEFES